jgi:hypothetical protein
MRSRSVSSRFPKRVIPAPAIQTSIRHPFQTGAAACQCFQPGWQYGHARNRRVYGRNARRVASLERAEAEGSEGWSPTTGGVDAAGIRIWNSRMSRKRYVRWSPSALCRSRAIAADLRQGRLDQSTLELADRAMKATAGRGAGGETTGGAAQSASRSRFEESESDRVGIVPTSTRKGKGSATTGRDSNSRRYGATCGRCTSA